MADVTITLTGANGDTITLGYGDFILESEVSGFGRPPVKVRIDENASDGGTFRYSRRSIREIDMPVMVSGVNRTEVESKLRRLARILDDSTGIGTTITVTYASGEVWFIEGHNVSGADTKFGENGVLTFARWLLVFQCPQPYWTRQAPVSYSVAAAASGRGLLSPNTMANMKVAAAQVLGNISVDNPGDVSAPPTYILNGPFDSVTIQNASGVGFVYNAPVIAGNSVTINTATGTVTDQAGANKYASLSAAPKFFNIPAGTSPVLMTAVNSTTATLLQLNFQPRKEVVF